jgi:hypothetical protein
MKKVNSKSKEKDPLLEDVGEDLNEIKYNIIYLTHGKKHFLEETYFSILFLCNQMKDIIFKIHIYTDKPDYFEAFHHLDIQFNLLTEEKINHWKGENQYLHRLKINVMLDISENYPNEIYLFLDSDTFITAPINSVLERIKPEQFVLDYDEGLLSQKKRTHIRNLYEVLLNNKQLNIEMDPELRMWNSGVIGLNGVNSEILKEILETTDALSELLKSHILEQFAFAYHFQKNGKVQKACDTIHHYWYFKEMRGVIQEFFKKNKFLPLEEQIANVERWNPQKIGIEKWNYKQSSFWSKFLFRLTHFRKWKANLDHIH